VRVIFGYLLLVLGGVVTGKNIRSLIAFTRRKR